MSKAYFVVRATVADAAKRKAFDTWYQNQHLPDASKSLGVTRGMAVLEPHRNLAASGDV
jgi:hypothetical protein